ncbi:hypothetical protein VTN00DRAFT_4949 [Thermoascus crustaceus]|uniref:uncharacterized protein n=1 Tax=Thermoascus crustaceus TaxID=5088 RepID=UPI003742B56B
MGSHFHPSGNSVPTDPHKHLRDHLQHMYNGRKGFNGYSFRRPKATADEINTRIDELGAVEEGKYRTPWGKVVTKKLDLDTYFSTTRKVPRRLIVQATDRALGQYPLRHWQHRRIEGDVPLVIKLSEFCLNPLKVDDPKAKRPVQRRIIEWFLSILLVMLLGWIIQVLLLYDVVTAPWTDDENPEQYDAYLNKDWEWPKHAINFLDQRPSNHIRRSVVAHLNTARRLVVKDKNGGQWISRPTEEIRHPLTGVLPRYIFLSFSRRSFPPQFPMKEFLHRAAEAMVNHENAELKEDETPVTAFWLDLDCVSHDNEEETTKDTNSICDAVRGAARVYVVLPHNTKEEKLHWGRRVWTLPEALLAANKIRSCVPKPSDLSGNQGFECHRLTLTEMYDTFWKVEERDYQQTRGRWGGIFHNAEISHLIKHFSNTLQLSELQLFSVAVQALVRRGTSSKDGQPVEGYTQTALAYAAMGLLAYRITPDESDNNFQAIARLSLVNDSNQLLERLACLSPRYMPDRDEPNNTAAGSESILMNMADSDQFDTHLWDIKPMCHIVGIGDEEDTPTIILGQCRAIPIRWKSFPRLKYVCNLTGFRARLSRKVVRYGGSLYGIGMSFLWNLLPLTLAVYNSSDQTLEAFLNFYFVGMAAAFAIGWIISLFAPLAVRQLCEANRLGNSCYLIGFEGTMPIWKIEHVVFGNVRGRLRYAPSSTPFAKGFRKEKIREVEEHFDTDMNVLENQLAPGQRFFTIVDTGDYTVSLIAAGRPPTVALLCGREGGMLRAILCSWRFENNCLYKETVMRMRSSLYDAAFTMDWLTISLASQGAVGRARARAARHEARN